MIIPAFDMSIFLTKPKPITSLDERYAKVYFTCYPDDFDLYFEEISDRILEHQPCLIYYTKDMNEALSEEDKENVLSQMNLIVVPITQNLLSNPCRAIREDIDYAIQNNKPILPFMMQDGLETAYSSFACFCERQYITLHANDVTRINYSDKLKKYLEAILTDNETAQRVRNAFSAYVFLSYRHKDRSYANTLMRLIHKNPGCRNIAVWYDEFLTLGENFRQNIEAAMKKSVAFTLVVTPRILEEPGGKPNFIMSDEYKRARELEIPIFPIEMEKTDRKELLSKYKGIPPCIEPMDEKDFNTNFLNVLAQFGTHQDINEAEQDYLMGIAYLEGIDVEFDNARAVTLLTTSADNHHPEAIKKLISVYRYGQGADVNHHLALEWFRKHLTQCEKVYQKDQSDEKGIECIREFLDYAEYCREIGQVRQSIVACEKVMAIAESMCRNQPAGKINITAIEYQAIACIALGDVYELCDSGQAFEYHRKASELMKLIVELAGSGDWLFTLAVTHVKIGGWYEKHGKIVDAMHHYQKARNFTVTIVNGGRTRKALRLLEVCDNRYGTAFQSIGTEEGLRTAFKYFMEALEIAQDLLHEYRDEEAYRDYSISLEKIGRFAMCTGNLEHALTAFEEKRTIDEKLLKKTHSYQNQRNVSITYEQLGVIHSSKGDYDTAEQWFSKCLQLRNKMLECNRDHPQIKRDLYAVHMLMFEMYYNAESPEMADTHYRLAEKNILELVDTNGDVFLVDLLQCYYKYGELTKKTDPSGARQALLKGAAVVNAQNERQSENMSFVSISRMIHELLLELSDGDEGERIESSENGVVHSKESMARNEMEESGQGNDGGASENVSGLRVYYEMAMAIFQNGEYAKTCEAMEEGIKTADRLLEVYSSDTEIIRMAAHMCQVLHEFYRCLDHCEKQKYVSAQKNLHYRQMLCNLENSNENQFALAQAMVGVALEDPRNVDIARLDEGCKIMQQLCQREPNNESYAELFAVISHIRAMM